MKESATKDRKTESPRIRSRQRLYPLFLTGFVFIAAGLYFGVEAYRAPSAEVDRGPIAVVEALVAPTELFIGEGSEATRFRYGPTPSTGYAVHLRQVLAPLDGEEGRGGIETTIALRLLQQAERVSPEDEDGALRAQRTMEQVRIDVVEDGRPVGRGISRQLELLMENARQSVLMASHGPTEKMTWLTETNPQLMQTLLLVHDGLELLHPHLRFDRVLPGESWTYRLEPRLLVVDEEMGADATGTIVIDQRFDGFHQTEYGRFGVLVQNMVLTLAGTVGEEEESFQIEGNGKGLVFFDLDAGQVAGSSLSLDRRWSRDGGRTWLKSRTELNLRREETSQKR